MTISVTDLDSDLDCAIADLPTVLTIAGLVSGATVNCIAGDLSVGNDLDLAGTLPEKSIPFVVPIAAFATRPTKGVTCTANNVIYRVRRVVTSPDDVALILECTEDER